MAPAEIVYVHDKHIWDSGKTFGRHSGAGTAKVHHIECDKDVSAALVAYKVQAALDGAPLKTLIFNGHGNCGSILIGHGINTGNFSALRVLRPSFMAAPGGGSIEIHSCHFLSSGSVNEKIYYLALGQRVWANRESWTSMDDHGAKAKMAIQKAGAGQKAALALAATTGARVKAAYLAQQTDKVGKFEGLWGCAWPDGRTFKQYPAQVRPDRVV